MAFTRIEESDMSGKGVIPLADTPGLSSTEMKAKFEQVVREVTNVFFNNVVDELNDTNIYGKTVSSTMVADDTKIATMLSIINYFSTLGGGDMMKAIYDSDDNGKVDLSEDSELLNGHADTYFAQAPLPFTATITTTWTSDGTVAPFYQDISVSGILVSDVPFVDIAFTGTWSTDELIADDYGNILRVVTSDDSIRVYASEETTVAIPISLRVVR